MNKKKITRALGAAAMAASVGAALLVATPANAHTAPPITITIWTFGDVIQPGMVRAYKKIHPEVTLSLKKSDLDPSMTNLQASCSAYVQSNRLGNPPDIAAVEVSYSGYWRAYPRCFTDLRTLNTSNANANAKSEVPTSSNIAANLNATDIKNNYLPWRWEQGVGYNDSVIGIPTDVGGLEVAYRVDLFKKAGLPTNRDQVSKLWPTWDKFIETGKKYMTKISAADKKKGVGFIDNVGTIYAASMNQGTYKFYKNNGTDAGELVYKVRGKIPVYDPKTKKQKLDSKKKPMWTTGWTLNPNITKAWNYTIKANDAGIGTRIGQYTTDWNVGMTNGKFATILAPAWMMDYIKGQAPTTKGKWDIASLPGGGGNQGGTQLTIPAWSTPERKQAAWDFINWYLAPEQQLTVFKTYGLFPSTKSIYSDPALVNYKDPFFNNAPVGKIYLTGIQKLKPIFEGKLQRAIDQVIGAGLGRVAAKKNTSLQSQIQVLSDIDKAVK
jgi:cellobiose transport system substrate-binding protein